MSLQQVATELVRTRIVLDAARAAYEAQRLTVHNALVNANQTSVVVAGYRIAHTPDAVSRSLKVVLLRDALQNHGITDAIATEIITEATVEVQRSGVISMFRLPEPDGNEQEA